MLYHGGAPLVGGGFMGVNIFFVLSGFLITSLLLGEWTKRLTIRLGQFWARRARRLLPALLVMLVGVAIYAKVFATPGEFADLRLDSLSTLFYVANWHFIFGGSSYFAQTAQPSPLEHMWSLSIEEQFYIVWPPVALVMLRLGRRLRPSRRLWPIFATAVVGALASALDMRLSYFAHASVTRLYEGTDTRCQDILVGASLAIGMAIWAQHRAPLSERAGRRRAVPKPWFGAAITPITRLGDRIAAGPGLPAGPRLVGAGRLPLPVVPGDHLRPDLFEGGYLLFAAGRGPGHLHRRHRPGRVAVPGARPIRCSATSGRSPTGPTCGTSRLFLLLDASPPPPLRPPAPGRAHRRHPGGGHRLLLPGRATDPAGQDAVDHRVEGLADDQCRVPGGGGGHRGRHRAFGRQRGGGRDSQADRVPVHRSAGGGDDVRGLPGLHRRMGHRHQQRPGPL